MNSFVNRWRQRLPYALAQAAGQHAAIPPGNDELHAIITQY